MALFPQPALLGNREVGMGRKLRGEGWQISGRDCGRTACWPPGMDMTDRPPLSEVAFNRRHTHAEGPGRLGLGHPSIDGRHDLLAQRHGVGHASASRRVRLRSNLFPFSNTL